MTTVSRKSISRLLSAILFSMVTVSAFADVVVVVSARSNLSGLTRQQVASLYLGQSTTFPDGRHAYVFNQPVGTAVRNEFNLKLTGMDEAQLNAYWSMRVFSGNGRPPKVLADSMAVKLRLMENPDNIGYIDKSSLDDSVRVVFAP